GRPLRRRLRRAVAPERGLPRADDRRRLLADPAGHAPALTPTECGRPPRRSRRGRPARPLAGCPPSTGPTPTKVVTSLHRGRRIRSFAPLRNIPLNTPPPPPCLSAT